MFPDAKPAAIWFVILLLVIGLTKVARLYPPAAPWVFSGVCLGLAGVVVYGIVSARRSARELSDYDAELRRVCPACGYDMRATPQRCPECGRKTQLTDVSPPPGFPAPGRGQHRRR